MSDSNTKTNCDCLATAVELPNSRRKYVYESRPVFPDRLGDGTVSGDDCGGLEFWNWRLSSAGCEHLTREAMDVQAQKTLRSRYIH